MENKTAAGAGRKKNYAPFIAIAAIIVAAASVLLFIFVINRPLDKAIIGRWEYSDGDIGKVRSVVTTVTSGSLQPDDVKGYFPEGSAIKEYFTFNDDGTFDYSIDVGSYSDMQSSAVTAVINYYIDHPADFLKFYGLADDYFEKNDVSGAKLSVFINIAFEEARKAVQNSVSGFEKNDNGTTTLVAGSYRVDGNRIYFTVTDSASSVYTPSENDSFTAKVSGGELVIVEDSFPAVPGLDGASFTAVE